jgi:hypothetical protein
MRAFALWLAVSSISSIACGSVRPTRAKVEPSTHVALGRAWVVGTWTTSTTSWADADESSDATRFGADGIFENGTWSGSRFLPALAAGPSGAAFVPRYEVDEKARSITFMLDGAEEHASYELESGQSTVHWKTVSGDSEHVTVFYARRR